MNLSGVSYTFVMIKNPKHDPKEPYLYFISNLKDARAIAGHYLKRWKIECCFKNLKTNGFNIEDINLQNHQKIELMIGVLAILYLMALREGMLRHLLKPIALKKYKDGKIQLSISYFRLGNAIMQGWFTDINLVLQHIEHLLDQNLMLSTGEILKNV
jgi:hypothetical protein